MGPRPGMTATLEAVVDDTMTAAAIGSGSVSGLSTPSMIALLESAAIAALASAVDEGISSVGTHIDVHHLAPTPVGMRVWATASLDEVEGKRLSFTVSARDEVGDIGRGRHERYLVELSSFEDRLRRRSPAGE
jgi:fluoroacetyl-CoA thioesterase